MPKVLGSVPRYPRAPAKGSSPAWGFFLQITPDTQELHSEKHKKPRRTPISQQRGLPILEQNTNVKLPTSSRDSRASLVQSKLPPGCWLAGQQAYRAAGLLPPSLPHTYSVTNTLQASLERSLHPTAEQSFFQGSCWQLY